MLLDQNPLQLDSEGIKERENGERGEGRQLFEDAIFQYFHQRGGGIMRGWRLIEGRLLFEEMRYLTFVP